LDLEKKIREGIENLKKSKEEVKEVKKEEKEVKTNNTKIIAFRGEDLYEIETNGTIKKKEPKGYNYNHMVGTSGPAIDEKVIINNSDGVFLLDLKDYSNKQISTNKNYGFIFTDKKNKKFYGVDVYSNFGKKNLYIIEPNGRAELVQNDFLESDKVSLKLSSLTFSNGLIYFIVDKYPDPTIFTYNPENGEKKIIQILNLKVVLSDNHFFYFQQVMFLIFMITVGLFHKLIYKRKKSLQ